MGSSAEEERLTSVGKGETCTQNRGGAEGGARQMQRGTLNPLLIASVYLGK